MGTRKPERLDGDKLDTVRNWGTDETQARLVRYSRKHLTDWSWGN